MSQSVSDQLEAVLRLVDLPPRELEFLKRRWRDSIVAMEPLARRARVGHYTLRLATVIGGVVLPALVTTGGSLDTMAPETGPLRWAAWGVSMVVALSAALDQILRPGDRWRHYRLLADKLKREGWLFAEANGAYAGATDHIAGFSRFVGNVEFLLAEDEEGYFAGLVPELRSQDGEPPSRHSRT